MSNIWENNEEIEIFREYLRIPTVHPDIDYGKEFVLNVCERSCESSLDSSASSL
jgi:hypothetical protein